MDLKMLQSERFWQLFLIGLAVGLNFPFPNNPWVMGLSAAISIWFGGSVVAGTADRLGKNIGGVTPAVTEVEDKE